MTATSTAPSNDWTAAESSPDYAAGAAPINATESTAETTAGTTYAQNRQTVLDSYQSSLDRINQMMNTVGINTRTAEASRNLYDANGQVSGIGQGVAANNLAPVLAAQGAADRAKASGLMSAESARNSAILSAKERQSTDLYNLKSSIVSGVRKAAATAASSPSSVQSQETKGRSLLKDIKSYDAAVNKYGKDAIIKINGRSFLKSPEERATLTGKTLANAKSVKTLNKVTGTAKEKPPTTLELNKSFNTDLGKFKDVVQVRAGEKGTITREKIIDALAHDHPDKARSAIAKEVYSAYPDTY